MGKKKVKKVVPSWATLSDEARSKLAKVGSMQRPKMTDAIVEAIKVHGLSKGLASASSIRAMIMTDHPDLPKMVLKKAMTKAIEQGMVTQVKGNGFSGSFKLGKGKPAVKKAADGKKGAKKARSDRQPLEEIFPLVFTWACNPKEASVGLIKKYLVANYPDLDLGVEMKHYRKALETAEKNGTLERLSGKRFLTLEGARRHYRQVHQGRPHVCWACKQSFGKEVALHAHLASDHPDVVGEEEDGAVQCLHCSQVFPSHMERVSHTRYCHMVETIDITSTELDEVTMVGGHVIEFGLGSEQIVALHTIP